MDKAVLSQYIDLKAEIVDMEELIRKTRQEIIKMEGRDYQVSDSVKGTRRDGTYGSIRITGYPYNLCERRKMLLEQREKKLDAFRDRLLELTNQADDYVNGLDDARMRRMLRYKYFDGLSWVQVAHRMGQGHTADSCRMSVSNFLKEEK